MIGYIYTLSKNNIPFYVGCTTDLHQRRFVHEINLKGTGASFDVLHDIEFNRKSELLHEEKFWIRQLVSWGFDLLNITHNNKNKTNSYYKLVTDNRRRCCRCNSLLSSHDKYFRNKKGQIKHYNCKNATSYGKS